MRVFGLTEIRSGLPDIDRISKSRGCKGENS